MNSKLGFLCFFVAAAFVVITGAAIVPNDNVEVIVAEVESPPHPKKRQMQVGQSVMTSLQSAGKFTVGVFCAFLVSSIKMTVVSVFLSFLWMTLVSLSIQYIPTSSLRQK